MPRSLPETHMRNTILAGLALLLAAGEASATPAPTVITNDAAAIGVQVWVDGWRDVYSPGERMRVRVRTDRDGYLAVFHIDTNGDVDVLYPYYEDEDGWVDGRRTLSLGTRGGYGHLRVRGGYGMGYILAVALD